MKTNCLADGLVNLAFSLPFGSHRLDDAQLDVVNLLREDVNRHLRTRQTRL